MRTRQAILGLLTTGAAFVAGCLLLPESSKIPRPVMDALDGPDKTAPNQYSFTLYSLEPAPMGIPSPTPNPPTETFHGHTILGKAEITDAVTRRKLVAAFNHGVSDHDGSVAACFIPHHGIRVQKLKDTVDLVICFKCAQVKVYINNQESETILISESPRPLFNEMLDRAHIPISKDGR